MLDHLALRTAVIDAQVRAAYELGIRQLVLLGAGLDARGHRLQLPDMLVFEVDHPSTQRYKRRRTQSWPPSAKEIRYVASDFSEAAFEAGLRGAGFDRSRPSCIVWEGVTMYLSESAVEHMLAALSRVCAPGSRLIATYIVEVPPQHSLIWGPGKALLSLMAEPLRFMSTPAAVSTLLSMHGFSALADNQPLSLASEYAVAPLPFQVAAPAESERVVIAERC
jgi:methyltransferase (TIGR00027 family)